MKISIVTTAYNEERNILPLLKEIEGAFKNIDYELLFVNDGSTDKTLAETDRAKNKRTKIINLAKRQGKSFALYTGLKNTSNEIIATIDADLQNNPKDVLKLLKILRSQGCDFCCGWRHKRNDVFLKRISSKIGHYFTNIFLKTGLHDINCPLMVFKKDCLKKIIFFENFHRFFPALVKFQGYKICEAKIEDRPRLHGKSKYGIRNRVFGSLKTILMIKYNKKSFLEK